MTVQLLLNEKTNNYRPTFQVKIVTGNSKETVIDFD